MAAAAAASHRPLGTFGAGSRYGRESTLPKRNRASRNRNSGKIRDECAGRISPSNIRRRNIK